MRQSRWRGAGHPTPAPPADMDHGGMQMPGMMSDADLRQLRLTGSTDFDLLFLDMMAAHHQGAIDMATTELRDVALPEVNSSPRRSSTPSRPNSTGSSSGSSSGRRRRSGDRELGRDATLGVLLHTPDHPPGRAFLW